MSFEAAKWGSEDPGSEILPTQHPTKLQEILGQVHPIFIEHQSPLVIPYTDLQVVAFIVHLHP